MPPGVPFSPWGLAGTTEGRRRLGPGPKDLEHQRDEGKDGEELQPGKKPPHISWPVKTPAERHPQKASVGHGDLC